MELGASKATDLQTPQRAETSSPRSCSRLKVRGVDVIREVMTTPTMICQELELSNRPSQSVKRGIRDNINRHSNHVMVESFPGAVTEPNDIHVSSDIASTESPEAEGLHSA
ncbi:hypothetical protein HA466_0016540 [Hirschfeldia incana]|nr:hypothetical protein HA466_0016540 [Hirschfeldia incana]